MKPSGIGGMAVMEGVMMKNKDEYAVAVRKPDNEIVVEKSTHKDFSDKVKLFKLPIFRGMLAFLDSMVVGVKVLNYSASFFEEDEAQTKKEKEKAKKKRDKIAAKDADFEIEEVSADKSTAVSKEEAAAKKSKDAEKDEKSNAILMVFAVLISIVLSVTLFMVLPVFITNLFSNFVENKYVLSFIEGIIRLSIFIGYVVLASSMPEIKRVFMYHGAEHKTINCLENGFELTVENVKWQSKQHKRCGTSFMLLVILISLLFFMVIPTNTLFWRVISRILLVPFIAGVSYEFIRLAGKSENKIVNVLSKPGLWMQGLTTKEPDDSMIEVAIQSVGAVFDWRAFLTTDAAEVKDTKSPKAKTAAKPQPADRQQSSGKQKTPGKQQPAGKQTGSPKQTEAGEKKQDDGKVAAASVKVKAADKITTAQTKAPSGKPEKTEAAGKAAGTVRSDASKRNTGAAPINFKPVTPSRSEEEDDEILKALDKFFDNGQKEQGKAVENE